MPFKQTVYIVGLFTGIREITRQNCTNLFWGATFLKLLEIKKAFIKTTNAFLYIGKKYYFFLFSMCLP